MLFSMETPLSPDISPDISGGWALAFRLYPFTARPPLAVAWTPGEVAPWDWTRGLDPWRQTTLGKERWEGWGDGKAFFSLLEKPKRLAFYPLNPSGVLLDHYFGQTPLGDTVESAWREFVAPPWGFLDSPLEGDGGKPTPPLVYPRLVRKHAIFELWPPLELPLYPKVERLGKVALKHPAHSQKFVEVCVQVAQAVGLIDPRGTGDHLPGWHRFALTVWTYLRFLKGYREHPSTWEVVIDDIRRQAEDGARTYRSPEGREEAAIVVSSTLNAIVRAMREGYPARGKEPSSTFPGLRGVAEYLTTQVWPRVLASVDWTVAAYLSYRGVDKPVRARVSSEDWVMLEIAQLYASEDKLRFCPNPNCGLPFLPKRRTQETCGRDACVKWLQRERKQHGLGPKRPRFRGLYGNSSG